MTRTTQRKTHATKSPARLEQWQLPPDPEGQNDARAHGADIVMKAFRKSKGGDRFETMCDMLAGLMHLCDRDPRFGNFDTMLDYARSCYANHTDPDLLEREWRQARPFR